MQPNTIGGEMQRIAQGVREGRRLRLLNLAMRERVAECAQATRARVSLLRALKRMAYKGHVLVWCEWRGTEGVYPGVPRLIPATAAAYDAWLAEQLAHADAPLHSKHMCRGLLHQRNK